MKLVRRSSHLTAFASKNKHNNHVILNEVKNLILLPTLIYVVRQKQILRYTAQDDMFGGRS